MRKAIITRLVDEVTDIKSVYQPYMAPDNATTPYAEIKFINKEPDALNGIGRFEYFQIFIYDKANDFATLENLANQIVIALDDIVLTTDAGLKFRAEYVQTLLDLFDDQKNLIFCRIDFRIPC